MFESLASLLRTRTPEVKTATAPAPAEADEDVAPIYQELAMTDELREALFPKASKMVSTIFDRPLSSSVQQPISQPAARSDRDCLFL
jgi:hypothetical protein